MESFTPTVTHATSTAKSARSPLPRPRLLRRITAALLLGGLASLGAMRADAQVAKLPANVTLAKPLGFRTTPGLSAPFVIAGHNYLQPGTVVRLVDAKPSLGGAGAFCRAEYQAKSGYVRCDDLSAFAAPAAPPPAAPATQPAAPSGVTSSTGHFKFCNDLSSCIAVCADPTCKLDVHGWAKGTHDTTCNFPSSLLSKIPDPPASALRAVPKTDHVFPRSGDVRGTQTVIDGLARLEKHIAGMGASWPKGYKIRVNSCYRSTVSEAANECDYIKKGQHLQAKWKGRTPANAAEQKEMQENLHQAELFLDPPGKLGLAWPGSGPHSEGRGCDVQIIDAAGHELTDCEMSNTVANKTNSRLLDEVMTNATVRAVRLNYEGWHYEFGDYENRSCRCVAPACNDQHFPTRCDGPKHCANP